MKIANPSDHESYSNLYHFSFGAYGGTTVYVWADHLEDALEEACDWLADNAPGLFTFFDKADYLAACESDVERTTVEDAYRDHSEVGHIRWETDWDTFYAIAERAEVDHMAIGHTTYPGLGSPPFLANWEWSAREVY